MSRWVRMMVALIGLLSSGCSVGGDAASPTPAKLYPTILEAPPRTPIPRLGPAPTVRTIDDRRFFYADALEQRQLPLLRRLKSDELGNFGGVEWRWQDGPQNGGLGYVTGILYFLREPSATLARYTSDPLFKAAKGDFSREQQNRVAEGWARRIGEGAASAGYGNARIPELTIHISRAEFERRRRVNGWQLPVNLVLRFNPAAEPDLPAVAGDVAPLIRTYPQEKGLGGPSPDIATYDAVVLRNGCLFIDGEGADDPLIELPLGIGLFRDKEGHLSFRSRYSKRPQLLGRIGTRLQLGWRTAPRPAPPALKEACGAKTIVTVSSADQAAGYGNLWFDVGQNAKRSGVPPQEALARANACILRSEQRLADARLGRTTRVSAGSCAAELRFVPPPPPITAPRS